MKHPLRHIPLIALMIGISSFVAFDGVEYVSSKKKPKYGIDISHHQGEIKWKQVPKDVQFVYIKATEGASLKDEKYKEYVKGAHDNGFKVGAYHFFRMTSGARAQFKNFKSVAKKSDMDLIPMVDVETLDGRGSRALRDSLNVFIKLVRDYYGKAPMIYAPMGIYNGHLGEAFNRYHLYIGRYGPKGAAGSDPPVINGKGTYTIWQYSEKGSVAGIPKRVDLAKFNPKHNIYSISLR